MLYLVSLGSNIQPEHFAGKALECLLTRFGSLYLYPCVYTKAQDVESENVFINALLWLQSSENPATVKEQLCLIETELGRDRSCAFRSVKDRSCDLDILYSGHEATLPLQWPELLTEPYLQAVLETDCPRAKVELEGVLLPERAAAIYFQAEPGDKWVIDQKADALPNWLKTGFACN